MATNFALVLKLWAIFVLSLVLIAFSVFQNGEVFCFSINPVCMNVLVIILSIILFACVVNIILCMRGTTRFLRDHPKNPGITDSPLKEYDNK